MEAEDDTPPETTKVRNDPARDREIARQGLTYTVEDMNAGRYRKKKRHSIPIKQPNGKYQLKEFEFRPGEATKMPQEQALQFLDIDPAFRVRNSNNQIVRPRRFAKEDMRTVHLRPYEIAVSVTQVVKSYLLELARSMPGGAERFAGHPEKHERQDLEEFIITGGMVEEGEDETGYPLDTVVAA